MLLKILVGGALASVLLGLGWQQRTIRQIQTELAEVPRRELSAPALASIPGQPEPTAELAAAQAEVRTLQMRVGALEARVQGLALALDQERQRQRQLGSNSTAIDPASTGELKAQVLDPHRGLKDRFRAFRMLMRNGLMDAQTTTAFLDEVMKLNDDELTAELFGALDNSGNLAAAPALIQGLQSNKVELRMRALDALSEMQSDATVVQWLRHVARSDAEARVRAEAVRVLAQAGNQP